MQKANDIKKELLQQMEKDSERAVYTNASSAWKIIAGHKRQLAKLKWVAAAGWIIAVACAVALHNLKVYVFKHDIEGLLTENEFWLIRYSDTTSIVLLAVCVLLTYLVYAKSKTLALLQICARLASIEEQLKRLSQVNSADSEA
jgi:hypothetical protein